MTPERVGIVVVSHSERLAEAAVELALQMVEGEPPPIGIAAGAADDVFGTDATRVADRVRELASPAGVLVLVDLGSALLSADMAVELLGDLDCEVRISPAPLVEGLVGAVVRSAIGDSLDAVDAEAQAAVAAKAGHLSPDAEPTATAEVELGNAQGLHARPAAALVRRASRLGGEVLVSNVTTGAGPADVRSLSALAALDARMGQTVRLDGFGAGASTAVDELAALIRSGFGEAAAPIGVSPGRAVGPLVQMPDPVAEPTASEAIPVGERNPAAAQIAAAALEVRRDLDDRASRSRTTVKEVLEATALLAVDPELLDDARARVIGDGRSPERAVWEAAADVAARFRAPGGYLAGRAADVEDVRDRIVAKLTGQPTPGPPDRDEPFVLAAVDLAPADTALLDPDTCAALVTEQGGPTSHTAIVAREFGIPAVAGVHDATQIAPGTRLLVDGDTGTIEIEPSADVVVRVADPIEPPDRSADRHHVQLLANISDPADAAAASKAGAEGVGLLRTEFCFTRRTMAPSVAEQMEAYRSVLAAFPGRRVVVRTLDAGADKLLPFVAAAPAPNPALGVRGIRTSQRQPELLDTQLTAIAEAAIAEAADVWVMAPMITTPSEAAQFVDRCEAKGIDRAGVMIETPAAALLAHQILTHARFGSLGTNDLAQYVMAADRTVGDLAWLNDPWQPAVLRLVAEAVRCGVERDRPMGVCGEAAADPALAAVLTGLGVSSLSMAPRAIAGVAEALAAIAPRACQELAELVLAAPDADAARAAARRALGR